MNVERSTLQRWLEEVRIADRAAQDVPDKATRLKIRRPLWFVEGQLCSLLVGFPADDSDASHRDAAPRFDPD